MPFWAQGFAPPPATRARFFVAAVPRRAFARAAWNAWNRTTPRFFRVASPSGSATDPDALPSAAMTGAWPAGAVGSGRDSIFSRGFGFGASARGCGATVRVAGRATLRPC